MRRQTSVATLLYSHLFPNPGPSDPPNFQTHLARDLVPEIRIETATFYGSLDSIEARYPGLNYCHGPHRMRLGRFPHHARLFRAIDDMNITNQEVMDLVRWEGTLWARQRFERDEGVKVRDTTGDGIGEWVDPRKHPRQKDLIRIKSEVKVAEGLHVDMMIDDQNDQHPDLDHDILDDEPEDGDEDDDDVSEDIRSVGHDLNRRLLAAIAARQQGINVEMDPEFEAYLKELVESGNLSATSRPVDGPIAPISALALPVPSIRAVSSTTAPSPTAPFSLTGPRARTSVSSITSATASNTLRQPAV